MVLQLVISGIALILLDQLHPTGLGGGNNSMMYTLPAMVDGVAINASYTPRGTGADSSTASGVTYTGVEGLTASYGMGDGSDESLMELHLNYHMLSVQ